MNSVGARSTSVIASRPPVRKHYVRAAVQRLRAEDGMTVIELVVAATLMVGAVAIIGGFLVSMLNSGAFAQGQSATLDNARNTVQAIEKEVRAAESLVWCSPAGSCLQIDTQSPSGAPKTVKYTHSGTDLQRAVFDVGSGTWGTPQTVVERVDNNGSQPLFDCDTSSTLLHVIVDLYLRPTPNSAPNFELKTSVRPRNFPAVSTCP